MPCVVRLAWLLAAPLATAIDLRSLSFGGRQPHLLARPARTNVSQPFLLPTGIVPKRYEVNLVLDPSKTAFSGDETITVDVVEDGVNEVVLHVKNLRIMSPTFLWPSPFNDSDASSSPDAPSPPPAGRHMGPSSVQYNVREGIVVMRFPYAIPLGEGTITMQFFGEISDEMSGLYRSVYTDAQGNPKMLLATQLEPISARKVFPCWDEPGRKAVFKISVTMPNMLQAISNTPVESSYPVGVNTKMVTFADTAVMSTYVLSLVVGEFDFVEATTGHGVLMRVYTPKGRSAEGEFALGVATKLLDRFDDYFGIRFPLPKLDLLSLPEFGAGAMENFGLITFRESLLLIDKDTASARQKQDVGIVTAHELAHQWFGNLVTMAWWDDLWLNEGFATWMEYCGLAKIYPEYDLWAQFEVGVFEEGLRLDELVHSHPIHAPIDHAEEASEYFDDITYKKSAAVINMLYSYIGADAFKRGLRLHMRRHAYSSARTTDLWQAWSEVTGLPIAKIMQGWTEQQNFPYISVTHVGRDEEKGEAILQLEQHAIVDLPGSKGDALWSIPINAASVGGAAKPTTVLMDTKTMQIQVPQPDPNAGVGVNVGRPAPIRVLYGRLMAQSLADAVSSKALPPAERATLLYDGYRLFRAHKYDYMDLITLVAAYREEDSYVVWAALDEVLIGVDRLVVGGEFLTLMFWQMWVFQFLELGWKAAGVGWESPGGTDDHVTELFRGIMVDVQTRLRGTAMLPEAQRRYTAFVSSPTAAAAAAVLPDAIRTSVFQLVLKKGGQAEYDQLVSLYKRSSNAAQEHILRAIGYAHGDELKLAALQWSISGAVKTQDVHHVFRSVSESSPMGRDVAWAFFKEHVTELSKRYPTPLLNKIITYSASGFSTPEHEEEVVGFLETLDLPGSERTLAIAIETIQKDRSVVEHFRNGGYMYPLLPTRAEEPPADGAEGPAADGGQLM